MATPTITKISRNNIQCLEWERSLSEHASPAVSFAVRPVIAASSPVSVRAVTGRSATAPPPAAPVIVSVTITILPVSALATTPTAISTV